MGRVDPTWAEVESELSARVAAAGLTINSPWGELEGRVISELPTGYGYLRAAAVLTEMRRKARERDRHGNQISAFRTSNQMP